MSLLSDFVQAAYLGLSRVADIFTFSSSLTEITLDSTSTTSSTTPALNLKNAKNAVDSGGMVRFYAQNSTPTAYLSATIKGSLHVQTAGSESGMLEFLLPKAGVSKTIAMRGDLGAFVCTATGEFTLGSTAYRWGSAMFGDSTDVVKGDVTADLANTALVMQTTSNHDIDVKPNGTRVLRAAKEGDVVLGKTGMTTAATVGFPYMPVVTGVHTGVPTARAGFVPFIYDSTNNKIGVYTGGAWKWTPALT